MNFEFTTMAPQLQDHIDEIPNLDLAKSIQAITDLLPGLKGTVSPTWKYIIHHPDYEGEANLNDLGRHFLGCAHRCLTEHAPFSLRLLHHSMDNPFASLYGGLYRIANEGYEKGTIHPEPSETEGCACCAGEPDATILAGFHEGEAFYYEEEEYHEIWGDAESCGSRYSIWEDGKGWTVRHLAASKEQMEEAMSRDSAALGVGSKL